MVAKCGLLLARKVLSFAKTVSSEWDEVRGFEHSLFVAPYHSCDGTKLSTPQDSNVIECFSD